MSKVLGFYRPHDPNLGAISFEGEKSLTQQSFKDECDINVLMKRYERTGVLEHINRTQGVFGDFSEVVDFASAFDIVRQAEMMFMTLPSRVRADFNNNPGEFLAFAQDPANAAKMIEYGLAKPVDVPPSDAPAAAPAAAPAPSGGTPPGA